MKPKARRLIILILMMIGLGLSLLLALFALRENITFFYTPTDLRTQSPLKKTFRLGGLVEKGSIHPMPDHVSISFRVTDQKNSIIVIYIGAVPDLFREGQGVVAKGSLDSRGIFRATELLAKHDATYKPPELRKALERIKS